MSAMPAARVTELGSLDRTGRLGRHGQREQDGAAAGPQLREGQPGEPHGRHQLELEVGLPGAVVDRLDGAARGAPRVVDDPVDTPPARHGGLRRTPRGPRAARRRPAAPARRRPQPGSPRSAARSRSSSRPHTATAAPSAASCVARARPKSVGAPGDEDGLARQFQIHASLLSSADDRHLGEERIGLPLRAQPHELQPRPARVVLGVPVAPTVDPVPGGGPGDDRLLGVPRVQVRTRAPCSRSTAPGG